MKILLNTILIFLGLINYSQAQDLKVVENFNIEQYIGTWYEIARLPNWFQEDCVSDTVAKYTKIDDTKIEVENQCLLKSGKTDISTGVAKFQGDSNIGKLSVTFIPKWLRWTNIGNGDYYVISTDYTNLALVGSPNRKYLWILARTKNPSQESVQKMVQLAKDSGFDTDILVFDTK